MPRACWHGGWFSGVGCAAWSCESDLQLLDVVSDPPAEQIELAFRATAGVGQAFGPVSLVAGRAVDIRHLHHEHRSFAGAECGVRILDEIRGFGVVNLRHCGMFLSSADRCQPFHVKQTRADYLQQMHACQQRIHKKSR